MILLAQFVWQGASFLLGGVLLGYFFSRWKEQRQRVQREDDQKSAFENTRREAKAVLRGAPLAANEEALNLREQAEKSFSARRRELIDLEQRLAERETLINRQLEGLVQQ